MRRVRRLHCLPHPGARGAHRCSTRNLSATVMALSGGGSWNGNVMSAFSRNRRRILSLWLPRLPIDRIKRQLWCGNAAPANPCIVVAKQNNALQIFALDDAAAHLGLDVGLPLANARAICPQLQVFDADEAADARALNAIAAWCDRFTPLVTLDSPHGLFLDITGCVHLFGGEAAMMRRVWLLPPPPALIRRRGRAGHRGRRPLDAAQR